MADLTALKAEIDTDPLIRGYAAMDDGQVADSLMNTIDRERNRASMTASEVLNAVVVSDLDAVTAAQQVKFWNLMGIGELNPFGVEVTILTNIFGSGSATIAALAILRKESVSRAVELGLGSVNVKDVTRARAI